MQFLLTTIILTVTVSFGTSALAAPVAATDSIAARYLPWNCNSSGQCMRDSVEDTASTVHHYKVEPELEVVKMKADSIVARYMPWFCDLGGCSSFRRDVVDEAIVKRNE